MRSHRRTVLAAACAAFIGMGASVPAHAQAPFSLSYDPSIRSAGTGGACNAVFWGGDPNDWANPALLGYHAGIRYEWGKTQLVPGFATDVFFKSQRLSVGWGGIGIGIPGNLNGYGSMLLDYGVSEGTDQQGNPTGPFDSFEAARSWGLGVSIGELLGATMRMGGREAPAFTRYGDIALGLNDKHVSVDLAPEAARGKAEADARDVGFLVRATPLNRLDAAGGEPAASGLPLRLDLSYGWSVLNYNDALLVFVDERQANPLSRIHKNGLAGRAVLGLTESLQEMLGHRDWLMRSLSPLISVGFANDWEHITAGDSGPGYNVQRYGGELSVVNVFHLRFGHVTDKAGGIRGGTSGWGLGLQIGDFAGFRYDRASIPQARDADLPNVKRRGYTVYVDPFRLAQELSRSN